MQVVPARNQKDARSAKALIKVFESLNKSPFQSGIGTILMHDGKAEVFDENSACTSRVDFNTKTSCFLGQIRVLCRDQALISEYKQKGRRVCGALSV